MLFQNLSQYIQDPPEMVRYFLFWRHT